MIKNIRYGLQNGISKYIKDVENGLSCNCVCAGCGGILVARKGKKQTHHFAHYNTDEEMVDLAIINAKAIYKNYIKHNY